MINPDYLKKGDKVAIISPAGKIDKSKINNAVKILSGWGLDVITGKNSGKIYNQFAGTDEERIYDFQQMLDDKNIKAIFSSRGGYGSIRIIDKLNFDNFKKNPKWIIGFSDITVFHVYINNNLNIETIHGAMPKKFPDYPDENKSLKSLKSILFGNEINYGIKDHKLNITGKTEGVLTGGNLSILYSLNGTKYDIDTKDKILFIEDLSEYLYHIDRIMMNFKLSGKFDNLKGLIVGDFIDIKDNNTKFGKTVYEIIYEHISEYKIPVCFGFPAGHNDINIAMKFGNKIKFAVNSEGVDIIHTN